ncbi:hypothetical protein L4D09_28365 [Photobacterium makurazakiensis]|uniref:hypothetical protein n=1 Tax=Photobacterium makurazakiensis TaxID=2910234 RepID=UPI003D09869E
MKKWERLDKRVYRSFYFALERKGHLSLISIVKSQRKILNQKMGGMFSPREVHQVNTLDVNYEKVNSKRIENFKKRKTIGEAELAMRDCWR